LTQFQNLNPKSPLGNELFEHFARHVALTALGNRACTRQISPDFDSDNENDKYSNPCLPVRRGEVLKEQPGTTDWTQILAE